MTQRSLGIRALALAGATVLFTSGCAYLKQVSSPSAGSFGAAGRPSLSSDARFVAYAATAETSNPSVPYGVYVLDTVTGTRELVSVSSSEVPGNAWSGEPAISGDGRYVAFASDSDNLVAGDTNDVDDVFVRDRAAGTTVRVSVDSNEVEVLDPSNEPSISADGTKVAFVSDSDDLDPLDGNGSSDVYVRDLTAGTTTLASIGPDNLPADFGAWDPAISGDGRIVTFTTDTALRTGDLNDSDDVYLRNLAARGTQWVSRPRSGFPEGGGGERGVPSYDGSLIAFSSAASDLPDGFTDNLAKSDVFLRNVTASTTERISVSPTGQLLNDHSFAPSISSDGSRVAFTSAANASGTDTNGAIADLFVRDRALPTTRLASTAFLLDQLPQPSTLGVLSPDGRYAAWHSPGAFLWDDTNNVNDVYLHAVDVPKVDTIAPTSVARGATVTLTITGNTFLPGAKVVVPAGLTVGTATVNPTTMTVSLTVSPTATPGKYSVHVQNLGTGPGPDSGALGRCLDCLTVT